MKTLTWMFWEKCFRVKHAETAEQSREFVFSAVHSISRQYCWIIHGVFDLGLTHRCRRVSTLVTIVPHWFFDLNWDHCSHRALWYTIWQSKHSMYHSCNIQCSLVRKLLGWQVYCCPQLRRTVSLNRIQTYDKVDLFDVAFPIKFVAKNAFLTRPDDTRGISRKWLSFIDSCVELV